MKLRILFFSSLLVLNPHPCHASKPDLATLQAQAAKGDANAELELRRAYHLGHGLPRDFAKAIALYRQAAAQGNAKAMYNLGYIYDHGQGVPRDDKTAQDWFQKSADGGLQAGELELGLAYFNGDTVLHQDYVTSAKWLKLAAKQADSPVQTGMAVNALGSLFENGWGVPRDGDQAVKWYREGADLGDVKARSNLGRIYQEGLAIKRDMVQSYMWTKLAASQGDPLAMHLYSENVASKVFTPEQISAGDQMLADYQAKHNELPVTSVPLVAEPETMAAFPRTNATVAPAVPTGTPTPATPAPAPSPGSVIAPAPPAGK